ncbi:MAG: winged helix-turn-helix transcriptional regulator [Alphaproteobacteria bacterium]|nr:MAG: winged helix-turn-helix transcriptional regulator [Alphaproteobacteria bacterium]
MTTAVPVDPGQREQQGGRRTGKTGGMSDTLIRKKRTEREQEIMLRLLEEVANDESLSQSRFAQQVGIAKGLANAYFNRCLQKGWIKLRQVPKQRFLYYLTPQGFAEKASLTAKFLSCSYQFYRDARADLGATMEKASRNGHTRLAGLGDGELAEITAIVSEEAPADVVCFIAAGSSRERVVGRPVLADWDADGELHAAVLATLEEPKSVYQAFTAAHPDVPVYVPGQLHALVWDREGTRP